MTGATSRRPRGARPDGRLGSTSDGEGCHLMRLTYQIKALTVMAHEQPGRRWEVP